LLQPGRAPSTPRPCRQARLHSSHAAQARGERSAPLGHAAPEGRLNLTRPYGALHASSPPQPRARARGTMAGAPHGAYALPPPDVPARPFPCRQARLHSSHAAQARGERSAPPGPCSPVGAFEPHSPRATLSRRCVEHSAFLVHDSPLVPRRSGMLFPLTRMASGITVYP